MCGFWLLMYDLINLLLFLQLLWGPLHPELAVKSLCGDRPSTPALKGIVGAWGSQSWLLRSESHSPAVSLESGGHWATPGRTASCPHTSPSCDHTQVGILPAKSTGGQPGDLLARWLFAGMTCIRQCPWGRGQWHRQGELLSPA